MRRGMSGCPNSFLQRAAAPAYCCRCCLLRLRLHCLLSVMDLASRSGTNDLHKPASRRRTGNLRGLDNRGGRS